MTTHIQHLTRNIKKKINYLEDNAKMSEENYDSLDKPFMMTDTNLEFKQDNRPLPIIPETLNDNLKLLYKIIGNANREITIKNWTIISLNKALYIYEQKRLKNQFIIFDFAYQYGGMGWIKILSCDLLTGSLFYRNDGGSSDWDRQFNENKILNYNKDNYKFIEFDEWFDNLDQFQQLF